MSQVLGLFASGLENLGFDFLICKVGIEIYTSVGCSQNYTLHLGST